MDHNFSESHLHLCACHKAVVKCSTTSHFKAQWNARKIRKTADAAAFPSPTIKISRQSGLLSAPYASLRSPAVRHRLQTMGARNKPFPFGDGDFVSASSISSA
jgi:hypothetical protein